MIWILGVGIGFLVAALIALVVAKKVFKVDKLSVKYLVGVMAVMAVCCGLMSSFFFNSEVREYKVLGFLWLIMGVLMILDTLRRVLAKVKENKGYGKNL
ncbi:hypothetical protein MOD96_02200 [Bacillus sp. S17B2]|uniref:hypothetical protein n=1 Tax=Bacillus sp. S17B2 TaxID=2918907 RepID=UPI00227DD221|nr:hypothetical protein [Bacillus sp. S17B2]